MTNEGRVEIMELMKCWQKFIEDIRNGKITSCLVPMIDGLD